MSFSSLEFIIIFMPVLLCIYYAALAISNFISNKSALANFVLMAGSLAFCFYADLNTGLYTNILVLCIQIFINYLVVYLIDYYSNKPGYIKFRKGLFIFIILLDVFVLLLFKFYVRKLPIGISFYTFSMLAYAVDVYSRKVSAETNFINITTYFSMFPKLVQGPITRYENFVDKFRDRRVSLLALDRGLKLFIYGLALKVILADRIGCLFNDLQMIGFESISTPLAWLGALAYSMQLYFDFAGYSLMAMGLGRMLGFKIPLNFDNPYAAKSISEFYRRWHITLGQWFRDYIYIPLGGSRNGMIRTIFNLLVVWLVTGIWHGITLNFILWGLFLFIFIAIEKLFLGKFLQKSRVISHIYLWVVIVNSWVIFAIDDIKRLGVYFTRMFPFIPASYESNINPDDYIKYIKMYGVLLLIAVILCIPKVFRFFIAGKRKLWSSFVTAVLFVISLYYISMGMNNPFMYFVF